MDMHREKKKVQMAAGLFTVSVMAAVVLFKKKKQAEKEQRSLSSMLLEETIKKFPAPDRRKPWVYKRCMSRSKKGYVLPKTVRVEYGCTELDEFTDTFVIEPKQKKEKERYIFYLHGGGYWTEPNPLHFSFFRKISDKLGASVILPVYPKAPAHQVDEVHRMVKDRYLYLLEQKGILPEQILFMGDSAGGGLALAILEELRDETLPMPGLAFLISPWLDVTNSNPEMEQIQEVDPMLERERLAFQGKEYAGEHDPKEAKVSPLYGNLGGLPRTIVFAGTHEIIYADVLEMKKRAEEAELDMRFCIFEKQIHCFVGLPIPEGDEACEIIASEVEEHM